jgi:hypothetical protein
VEEEVGARSEELEDEKGLAMGCVERRLKLGDFGEEGRERKEDEVRGGRSEEEEGEKGPEPG